MTAKAAAEGDEREGKSGDRAGKAHGSIAKAGGILAVVTCQSATFVESEASVIGCETMSQGSVI